jgi:hypothetical protein
MVRSSLSLPQSCTSHFVHHLNFSPWVCFFIMKLVAIGRSWASAASSGPFLTEAAISTGPPPSSPSIKRRLFFTDLGRAPLFGSSHTSPPSRGSKLTAFTWIKINIASQYTWSYRGRVWKEQAARDNFTSPYSVFLIYHEFKRKGVRYKLVFSIIVFIQTSSSDCYLTSPRLASTSFIKKLNINQYNIPAQSSRVWLRQSCFQGAGDIWT